MQETRNRIILITGDGKGKTTSALGMVLRAVGHQLRVCILQFIKCRLDTGEMGALKQLPGVEMHVCGQGFIISKTDMAYAAHVHAAQEGLRLAVVKLKDPTFKMIVLDELCGAVTAGLLTVQDVTQALTKATRGKTIVLTGRDASPELIELADTVSRIECVKHGMKNGWAAQKGVEL